MNERSKVFAILYVVISSVTVLVMLTTSFELFHQKYFPSFMLAQKYALPLIISAMAVMFLAFFEPERLLQRRTVAVMRAFQAATLAIFSYYIATLNIKETSTGTLIVYAVQWIALLSGTVYFFLLRRNKAAQ